MKKQLRNLLDRESALAKVAAEPFERVPVSLYKYVRMENVPAFRDELFEAWSDLGVLGRVYVSQEGVNAQVSVPAPNMEAFRAQVDAIPAWKDVPFKIGFEGQGEAFWKLTIKVRDQIVADGLAEGTYDIEDVGRHLSAKEWNEAMEQGATVVDMRNAYESDIGHFEGAVCADVETFREQLPVVKELLEDKKAEKILLYCTGGIRCEKTSAYLKHHGFTDVNQLHGGIIDYARQVKEAGLETKFKGKNYVFDGRRAEVITDDVLGECYHCGAACNEHVDCANVGCHALMLQCEHCQFTRSQTCSTACQLINLLPQCIQTWWRRGRKAGMKILRRTH